MSEDALMFDHELEAERHLPIIIVSGENQGSREEFPLLARASAAATCHNSLALGCRGRCSDLPPPRARPRQENASRNQDEKTGEAPKGCYWGGDVDVYANSRSHREPVPDLAGSA